MSLFQLDLVSGGQAEIVLEEPDPFPSSYFISLEPSGGRVWQILTQILAASKRSVCEFSADLDRQGLKRHDVKDSAMSNLLQTSGHAFGIFWDIDLVLAGLDRTDNKKFIFVRDPRDAIVSSYVAMKDARGSATADRLRETPEADGGESNWVPMLDYVLSPYVEHLARRYRRCTAFCRSASNLTVLRYEDVMFGWRQLVADLVEKLDLKISLESAFAIADSSKGLIRGSPLVGPDLLGLQATFPEHLHKAATAVVEEKFAEGMAYFGYVPEGTAPIAFLDHMDEFLRAVSGRLATVSAECSDLAAQVRKAAKRAAAEKFQNVVLPVTILSPDGRTSRTTGNIRYHYSGYNPYATINPTEAIPIFDGSPAGIMEFTDAYSVPGSICLYDRNGVRITESCIRRGKGLTEFAYAGADTISLPTDFITINEPLVYLSWLENHWGHFLTEGISRLWAFIEYPELSKIAGFYFSSTAVHGNMMEFLRSLGLKIRVGECIPNRPVRYRKVFVPPASFSNGGEAYSIHRQPASAVIDLHLPENGSPVSDQPVFLSRSRLGGVRDIENQAELEKALARNGFLVVYPEELDLAEQIGLFNQHRHFFGCWGSAFHTVILSRLHGSMTTHVMCDCIPNENFLMFDSIVGNEANYVRSMFSVRGKQQVWPNLALAVDVEQVLDYCKGIL